MGCGFRVAFPVSAAVIAMAACGSGDDTRSHGSGGAAGAEDSGAGTGGSGGDAPAVDGGGGKPDGAAQTDAGSEGGLAGSGGQAGSDGGNATLVGAVQKGPFILGSSVLVAAIAANGTAVGLQFNGETT